MPLFGVFTYDLKYKISYLRTRVPGLMIMKTT